MWILFSFVDTVLKLIFEPLALDYNVFEIDFHSALKGAICLVVLASVAVLRNLSGSTSLFFFVWKLVQSTKDTT